MNDLCAARRAYRLAMRNVVLGSVLALTSACGDNVESVDEMQPEPIVAVCTEVELPAQLATLPHVTKVTERGCGAAVAAPARCFELTIDQPVDHAATDSATFSERLYLIHRGCDRPTVVADWGYANNAFFDDELTILFDANALWIEHRYQGESVPAIDAWDWRGLTIENGARDMHRVIESFKHVYGAAWVSTGASKGGITAAYHRFFFPDDVDGSVPYVAPASRDRQDPEYQAYLSRSLPEPCASRVRGAQIAAMTSRKPMMLTRLTAIGAEGYEAEYLDMMTASFDWGFWQAYGIDGCHTVPTDTASDDAFWSFYYRASGFGPGDEYMSNGALQYEWLVEQGFALQVGEHVAPLLQSPWATQSMEERFREWFPDVELPAYDGSVTRSVRRWVELRAESMLLIYGEVDPWSGGALPAPSRPSSARYFAPNASHGAQISHLPAAERADALARAEEMFGVPPAMSQMARASQAATDRERRFRSAGTVGVSWFHDRPLPR